MNTITLIKDGSIAYDGKTVASDPLMFLSFKVDLEKEYTLRSYFRMLEKYSLLVKLNAFFPSCLEQYLACPKSECRQSAFDHLEFSKTVEMIGYPGRPRLEVYNSFNGKRGNETIELKPFPLENLLDMPVRLGNLKHTVFGDKVDIFEFETVFSLFEFIDGIAWELSFQGTSMQCEIGR